MIELFVALGIVVGAALFVLLGQKVLVGKKIHFKKKGDGSERLIL